MRVCLAAVLALAVAPPAVIWDASPNYTASNREVTYNIDAIVIHTTEGVDTNQDGYYSECYYQAINWFNNPSAGASAHYVVSPWGEITQMVADDDIAWHATYYNNRSIGIECAGFASSSLTWRPELLAALTQLVAYLADRYAVPVVHPSGNATSSGGWYSGIGIVGHDQVQTSGSAAGSTYGVRTDPGPYFPWSTFIADVRQQLAPPAAANLQAVPRLEGGGVAVDFSWDASPGADGYWLDVAESMDDLTSMTGTFMNGFTGTATSTTWTALEPGRTYYWRVWSYNGYGGTHGYASDPLVTPSIESPPPGGGGGGGGGCRAGGGRGSITPVLAALSLLVICRLLARP